MNHINYETHGAIAVIGLTSPPLNSLGFPLRQQLAAGLDRAIDDPAIAAVVIIGSERAFSGGADITEFGTPLVFAHPNLLSLIDRLDASPKPVIAAIAGACMGGGLELALGCHHRIARADAQIALPEVKLGLLPGAGGTQRMPRLVGLERALNLIVSGAVVPASQFAGTPLFDHIIDNGDDLLQRALPLARERAAFAGPPPRVRDLPVERSNAEAFLQFARNMVRASAGPYPAPLACLEAVAGAATYDFDGGIANERKLFAGLLRTPESTALRHNFIAERAAGQIADLPRNTATRPIRRVGVIGAGTMGSGIAMNLLNAGIPVVLLEVKQEALDRGVATIRRNYENSFKKGKLTPTQLDQRMALLTPVLDYAPLADADLVIEAVFESMDAKQEVFRQLDKICKTGAILASNTSYLDVDRIAALTSRPQDVLGLHFFSPANVMRLLEIVRGAKTAPDVLATAMQLAKKIKKVAVVAGVCDGFIGNRMLERYLVAAHDLVVAGAQPQQVDTALQKFGMAMGPFRMMDLAGLDIGLATRKRRAAERPDLDFSSVADPLYEAGRFGQKTGAGWYRYEGGQRDPIPDAVTAEMIDRYRASKGVTPRRIADDDIVARCILALVNEGARILDEGIAQRASDIDVVFLNGYGFPALRGGPMHYADQLGLPDVVRSLRRFAADDDNAAWEPAPLIERLAAEGRTFN
ncbi:3-hydroxyacyl-CoA dehydrogenase NAD-binding domain-containing protein [Povalibacter sp.]|uniref:3-hydroxyacyl-CoA dehydrogenase NAD-binding domain-containing protein n=1 Tax=Povalibacter sp. TaxID=1962978 RepID=UPI002F421AD4